MLKYCSKTNDSMDMGFFNHRKTQFNSNDTNQGPEDTIRYPPTVSYTHLTLPTSDLV